MPCRGTHLGCVAPVVGGDAQDGALRIGYLALRVRQRRRPLQGDAPARLERNATAGCILRASPSNPFALARFAGRWFVKGTSRIMRCASRLRQHALPNLALHGPRVCTVNSKVQPARLIANADVRVVQAR